MAERATEHRTPMEQHPDVMALQRQYGQTLGSPQTVVGEGVLALAGVWAAISPWVLGFTATHPALTINNLVVGLVVAALGLGVTGTAERSGGLSWIAIPLGVWLIVSMWLGALAFPTVGVIWNNVITGAVTALFGAAVAFGTMMKMRKKT